MRLDQMVAPIAKPALKKFGFHEFHLFEHWPEIVGQQLAQDCVPVKLSRPSHRQQGATLVVRVAGYRSLDVQYSIPQILDRLNRFLGRQAINRIKLIQGPVSLENGPLPRRVRPLKPAEKSEVAEAASGIENDNLRRALQNFGQTIRQSSNPRRERR